VGGNDRIRLLIGQIYALLPATRRDAIGRQFVLPRVSWSAEYAEMVDRRTLATVQQALNLGRQLAFDYRSNYDADAQPRRHIVAPYLLYFRDGHTYLDTTVLQAPVDVLKLQLRAVQFRLDRVVLGSARMQRADVA
jgi:predicted DNA-binding transcriptional regulator YafY